MGVETLESEFMTNLGSEYVIVNDRVTIEGNGSVEKGCEAVQ